MIVTLYKLTSPKLDGEIIFTFNNGLLFGVQFKLKRPLSTRQLDAIRQDFPYHERETMTVGDIRLQPVTPDRKVLQTTQEKIAAWVSYYNKYVRAADGSPVKYVVSPKDAGMIRHKDVTDQLLTTYFTSNSVLFKNKYSIANYCKFYQQLSAEAAGAVRTNSFPNYYDKDFIKKIDGQRLSEYYRHLRSLGLVAKKNAVGDIIEFNHAPQSSPSESEKSETDRTL